MTSLPTHTRSLIALLCTVLLLTGCAEEGSSGTDIGNPETSVTTHFLGYDSEADGGLVLESGVTIDAAWIVVEQIALEDAASCGSDSVIDDAGPIVVNLLDGVETPRTPTFVRPSGDYCQVAFKLAVLNNADLLPADAPPELVDHSLFLTGTTDGLLLDLPFTIELDLEDQLTLTPTADAITLEGEQQSYIVGFALELLVDVDLLEQVGGLTEIVIDPSSDQSVLDELGLALQTSAQLFADTDLDGELSPDEALTPVAQ